MAAAERDALLATLKARFERHSERRRGLTWAAVEERLQASPAKLWSLAEMEKTGGEPDVVGQDAKSGELVFCDCAEESPKGRRSVCYDGEALRSRKENRPRAPTPAPGCPGALPAPAAKGGPRPAHCLRWRCGEQRPREPSPCH
jgi:hypothetical protein